MALGKSHLDVPHAVQKINWKKAVAFTCIALCLVGVGVLAGYFAGDAHGRNKTTSSHTAGCVSDQNSEAFKELPALKTDAAKQLLNDPNTPAAIKDLYQFVADPSIITPESTKAFIQQLQHWQLLQQQQGVTSGRRLSQAVNSSHPSASSSSNTTVDFKPFMKVAKDVLNYLRYKRSETLLPMLRQFSQSGGTQLSVTGYDPDLVQSEINSMMQKAPLDAYYRNVSRKCAHGPSHSNATGPAAFKAGRRLLIDHHNHNHHPARRLHQEAATSKPQTLRDMLCAVSSWSPSGVSSMTLDGKPLQCSVAEEGHLPGPAPLNVVIPVVFHCLRFHDASGYLLPILTSDDGATPTDLGQNLIDKTNKYYEGTGIQFKLQEVRSDPAEYEYLLMDSSSDWQVCASNDGNEYLDCLSAKSKTAAVTALVEALTINIFVSGSASVFCDSGSHVYSYCKGTSRGYSNPSGPWFGASADPKWTESVPGTDWVWISYDDFSPAVYNDARFWDGGAATLAHEIGHYLALMHTFDTQHGGNSCDGDGLQYGDDVPDTPASQSNQDYFASSQTDLSGWCSEFRKGFQPDTDIPSSFDSCPAAGHVTGNYPDPIYNVMNYIPDVCCMTFTPNQVSRLQEMVIKYRPKMVAKYTV